MQSNKVKKVIFVAISSLVCVVILISLAEILLRIFGYKPWQYYTKDAGEPRVYEYDSVIGWRNKEGSFTIRPYSPTGTPIQMNFLADGSRVTRVMREQLDENRDKIVILGGSFTQGWAISDDETFPWKLQNKYPHVEVLNYGTGGYGTFQSLLMLERVLDKSKRPVLVLYGFMGHHEERSVALPGWTRALSKLTKRRNRVAIPYCTIGEGDILVRHPPEPYPIWPLRERFALIPFLQYWYTLPIKWRRSFQKQLVTEKLMLEMHNRSKAYGANFGVVLLDASESERTHYLTFLRKQGTKVVDCVYPFTDEMKVPGEGHPNGAMNTRWAECIAKGLGPLGGRLFQP